MVGLFTLGTLELSGALGLFTFVFTCVLFTIVGVFTEEVDGGMYRGRSESGAAFGELMWTQFCLDPVLPGVSVGVVGDMRHVESVKSRTIA